jgi:hypothetical protein
MKLGNFNYENAVENLKRLMGSFPPVNIEMYTACDSVSKSGMSRQLKIFIILDNTPYCLGYGRVRGCGMDMGYHVADTIFYMAYPNSKDAGRTFTQRWL